MKKIFAVLNLLLLLGACSTGAEENAGFVGKNYQMQDAWNNTVITLGFAADEPRFYGSVVNNYFGNYQTDGNKITFGDAGSTMMMGPREEMEAERNYLQVLPQISSYRMDGTDLILSASDGKEYRFKEISKD